jgi:hypothetical protein
MALGREEPTVLGVVVGGGEIVRSVVSTVTRSLTSSLRIWSQLDGSMNRPMSSAACASVTTGRKQAPALAGLVGPAEELVKPVTPPAPELVLGLTYRTIGSAPLIPSTPWRSARLPCYLHSQNHLRHYATSCG